jgi:hypothetical protein
MIPRRFAIAASSSAIASSVAQRDQHARRFGPEHERDEEAGSRLPA